MKVPQELKSVRLWIEVFAEFLITTLFISFVCGCSLSWNPPSSVMHMSLSSGLGVATFAFTMWDVSSGLFNPALTIAFFIAKKKSLAQTVLYIIVQLIGSICGAAMVYGVSPDKAITDSNLAVNVRNPDVTVWQAFAVEIWIAFILILVVFAVGDPDRELKGYGPPLAIGFVVFINLNLSIYWAGPIIGASIAALVYHYIFAQRVISRYALSTFALENALDIEMPENVVANEQQITAENHFDRKNSKENGTMPQCQKNNKENGTMHT